ncbi:MAG: sensor domain-containing diguanylate cyclase [Anaerolineales bacterium]
MAKKQSRFGFTPREQRISALPSSVAGILILIFIAANGNGIWRQDTTDPVLLLQIGTIGTIYLIAFNFFIVPSLNSEPMLGWVNAIVAGLGLGLLTYVLPDQANIYLGFLLITALITCALISGRRPSYFLLFFTTFLTVIIRPEYITQINKLTLLLGLMIIAIIIVEAIMQLKRSSRDHIHRLETITDFSRAIASTLQTNQVMTLLNAAFQNSIEADTYFVGVRDGEEIRFELLYDDGEFYENQRAKLEGTLSGWVLNSQQRLFLPDLRKEVVLPGVRLVLAGRHKTSLSWMGVPMRGQSVDGLIAISSYRPNAFDRADLELLTALAEHAAQAIDNSFRHTQVELQSHLDSLTNVYNHGYFLKLLESHINKAEQEHQPISAIMLDIDHFKQYNDRYGHLAGDEILRNLCNIIKGHLKRTDAVGRWGGEEFVIALPNANGIQAQQIAERIRGSMLKLSVHNYEQTTIPMPTVSQGIAIYPLEADGVMKLIDLADKRLYVAKERGRNQVEPDKSHWEKLYETNSK